MSRPTDGRETDALLRSRLEDLAGLACKRGFAAGLFLTPEQQVMLLSHGNRLAKDKRLSFGFFGGYADAERQVALFTDPDFDGLPRLPLAGISLLELRTASGNGLSHRAVLGSVLAAGLERDRVGDILPFPGEGRAVLAVKDSVAEYLLRELARVGGESVTLTAAGLPEDFVPERKTEELRETVASLRLDCLAAAILHLSREDAKALILRGELARNHRTVLDPAAPFAEGDRLSIRHAGRYDVTSADTLDKTRSGRIRVTLLHYL